MLDILLLRKDLPTAVACHAPTARRSLDEMLTSVAELRAAADAMGRILAPVKD